MKQIDVRRDDGVVELVLDDPPLNILDLAALEELEAAFADLGDEAAVVVVRAEGKAFSAGADIGDHLPGRVETMIPTFHDVFRRMWALEAPTVASVHGQALGGGMELAVGCDFIVASEGAVFGQPEINVGVFPPVACLVLPRKTPWARALEVILTGEKISASEARKMGLVNRVVPEEELPTYTDRFVDNLAASSRPVLRLAKRAARRALGRPEEWREALDEIEEMYLDELMSLEDPVEGLRAFIDDRKPDWQGR